MPRSTVTDSPDCNTLHLCFARLVNGLSSCHKLKISTNNHVAPKPRRPTSGIFWRTMHKICLVPCQANGVATRPFFKMQTLISFQFRWENEAREQSAPVI